MNPKEPQWLMPKQTEPEKNCGCPQAVRAIYFKEKSTIFAEYINSQYNKYLFERKVQTLERLRKLHKNIVFLVC